MVHIAGEREVISEPDEASVTVEIPEIIDVRQIDWAKGNPDADVVIVKYSDFQYPACRFVPSSRDVM